MKTIAEIARDCNVSKTTINRHIVALDIKKDIETDQGGTMLLTEEQEQQIKKALKKYEPTRNARNVPRREKESGDAEKVIPEKIRELKRQIEEKEKQLEEKTAEIGRLHGIIEKQQALLETNQTLLDQQQKLMLVSQQLTIKQHKPGLLARLFRKDKPSDQGTESGADQATAETNDQ